MEKTQTVSTNGDAALQHRAASMQFATEHGEKRDIYRHLLERWQWWNARHFDGRLKVPYIRLTAPSTTRRHGEFHPVSAEGGTAEIRIRPSLLLGTESQSTLKGGEQYADGRLRFVEDVLLHEMVHQHVREVALLGEEQYRGHGRLFRDKCNQIGADLGLQEVEYKHRRKGGEKNGRCEYWPHNVRGADYYLGALLKKKKPSQVVGTVEPKLKLRDRTRTAVLSTRIPEELLELLRERAERDGVTQSSAAAALLEAALAGGGEKADPSK